MKKSILLSFAIIFCAMSINSLFAQQGPLPTSFSTDFSPNSYKGEFYSLDEGAEPDEFQIEFILGKMLVTIDRSSWHFLHWANYRRPGIIDMHKNPIIMFDVNANKQMELNLHVQGLGSTQTIKRTKTIPENVDTTLIFDFSSDINTISDTITELKFLFDVGTGVITFDNFKMGNATDTSFIEPTIDSIPDYIIPKNWNAYVELTGISDGGSDSTIFVDVFTMSGDTLTFYEIEDGDIEYTSPDSTARLIIDPIGLLTGELEYVARVSTSMGSIEKIFTVTAIDDTIAQQVNPWETQDTTSNDTTSFISYDEILSGKIYPNPTTGFIYVEFNDVISGKIELTDISGKLVYSENFADRKILRLNTLAYSKGIYTLIITSDEKLLKNQVIVQ